MFVLCFGFVSRDDYLLICRVDHIKREIHNASLVKRKVELLTQPFGFFSSHLLVGYTAFSVLTYW